MGVGAKKIAEVLADDINAPDDAKLNFFKMLVTGMCRKVFKGESMTIEWKSDSNYIVLLMTGGKIKEKLKINYFIMVYSEHIFDGIQPV